MGAGLHGRCKRHGCATARRPRHRDRRCRRARNVIAPNVLPGDIDRPGGPCPARLSRLAVAVAEPIPTIASSPKHSPAACGRGGECDRPREPQYPRGGGFQDRHSCGPRGLKAGLWRPKRVKVCGQPEERPAGGFRAGRGGLCRAYLSVPRECLITDAPSRRSDYGPRCLVKWGLPMTATTDRPTRSSRSSKRSDYADHNPPDPPNQCVSPLESA